MSMDGRERFAEELVPFAGLAIRCLERHVAVLQQLEERAQRQELEERAQRQERQRQLQQTPGTVISLISSSSDDDDEPASATGASSIDRGTDSPVSDQVKCLSWLKQVVDTKFGAGEWFQARSALRFANTLLKMQARGRVY